MEEDNRRSRTDRQAVSVGSCARDCGTARRIPPQSRFHGSTAARIATGFDPAFPRRRQSTKRQLALGAADKRQQSAALQSGSAPSATPAQPGTETKTRVQVCPFLPAAFRIPGNPGDGCKADRIVGGMTTRTGRSVREPKKSLNGHGGDNAMRTPSGFEGKRVRGAEKPSPSSGASEGAQIPY